MLCAGDSGVENLHFCGQAVSVCCKEYDPAKKSGTLCVRAEKPFSLTVETADGKRATLAIAEGYTEMAVADL